MKMQCFQLMLDKAEPRVGLWVQEMNIVEVLWLVHMLELLAETMARLPALPKEDA